MVSEERLRELARWACKRSEEGVVGPLGRAVEVLLPLWEAIKAGGHEPDYTNCRMCKAIAAGYRFFEPPPKEGT